MHEDAIASRTACALCHGHDTFGAMRSLSALLVFLAFHAQAQPPQGYYDAAEGLSGEALRQALNGIIAPHTVVPNSSIWAAFEFTDRKADGTVWDMYSDVPGGAPPYVFQFVTDQCGTYAAEGDCFNREHSFPQSWYGSDAPMSTDLFHLYPADAWVNQQRGNLAYGTVGNANWTSSNGGKRGPCNWPGCSGTVFEPIDDYKGDFARGFMYMLTRYLPLLSAWDSPMMANGEFLPWAESMLLSWHTADPVSSKEVERNNVVYSLQGNRNPYIDRPEWTHAIWGPFASVPEVVKPPARLWTHDGTLMVEWSGPDATGSLRVLDAAGRLVLKERIAGPRAEVELPISPGAYVAVLELSNHRSVVRFVR
jgi:endonuclease I